MVLRRNLKLLLCIGGMLSIPAIAGAVPVGHGTATTDVVGDATNNQSCSYFVFVDQTYDVFGISVNLGTDLGAGVVCFASVTAGVGSPSTCQSTPDDSIWSSTSESTTVCLNPPSCTHSSFVSVGDVAPSGSLATLLGSDIASTADGETDFDSVIGASTIPGCTLSGTVYRLTGTISVNAFLKQTTSVGSDQTVTFPETTYFNPLTGAEEPVELDVTFSGVTEAGTTTVTVTSNSAAEAPSNFAYSVGGFQAAFLEISTTATITPPIEICTSYADLDSDGFVDGTSPLIPEDALSLLHGEGGTFVDRTSSRDAVSNVICATVDSLSPFAVMVRTNGICAAENDPCDDGDACTVTDLCNASLECVGSGAPDCDDGSICTEDVCVGPGGCTHPPVVLADCNVSNAKGTFSVKNSADDTKDQLKFQWGKGSIALAELGDPTGSNTYTLCAFDGNEVMASAVAPAASTCGEDPCWTLSDKGVKYSDSSKPPLNDGISQVAGSASTEGKAKLALKIAGETMAPLAIGAINYPVTVQVQTSAGECWEQQFLSTDEKKNDGSQLKLGHKAP